MEGVKVSSNWSDLTAQMKAPRNNNAIPKLAIISTVITVILYNKYISKLSDLSILFKKILPELQIGWKKFIFRSYFAI